MPGDPPVQLALSEGLQCYAGDIDRHDAEWEVLCLMLWQFVNVHGQTVCLVFRQEVQDVHEPQEPATSEVSGRVKACVAEVLKSVDA